MTKLESVLIASIVPFFWVVFAMASVGEKQPKNSGEVYDWTLPIAIAGLVVPAAGVGYVAGFSHGMRREP